MQQRHGEMDDSIRRHPSSLAPPERHRRFGPWGIFAAVVSALGLLAAVLLVVTAAGDDQPAQPGAVGAQAPEFDLASIDGTDRVRLSELRGRVVVVAFERGNCSCRASEVVLDQTWRAFRNLGVSVVGIRRGELPVTASGLSTPGPWPVLADPEGETASAYGVHGEIETFVIDEDGTVVAGLAGPVTAPVLVAQLAMVLGDGATPLRLPSPAATNSA
jgi:cytochrome c biogenesis protein CcmG/thiol:disulfide interchange protein DsbE